MAGRSIDSLCFIGRPYPMISRSADIDGENEAVKLAIDAAAGAKKQ